MKKPEEPIESIELILLNAIKDAEIRGYNRAVEEAANLFEEPKSMAGNRFNDGYLYARAECRDEIRKLRKPERQDE